MTARNTDDDTSREEHWNAAYDASGSTGVSWYQPEPTVSLAIIESLDIHSGAGIIDIGGGAAALTDTLVERAFSDLTVLDISQQALDLSRARLGERARMVTWIQADVLTWEPTRTYDLWHDRAVFHFLVRSKDQRTYVRTLLSGLAPGGTALFGTFAPDGPTHCSGLPVARYSARTLGAVLGTEFALLDEREEAHVTRSGAVQPFTWTAFRRRSVS